MNRKMELSICSGRGSNKWNNLYQPTVYGNVEAKFAVSSLIIAMKLMTKRMDRYTRWYDLLYIYV